MKAARQGDHLRLTFDRFEARLLQSILDALITNYQVPPEQLDAKAAEAWYSRRGCQTAGMSPEDTRDWLAQLHGYKSANLALLRRCRAQLADPHHDPIELVVPVDQAPALMTALNDHRLLLAARHDIGEAEMQMPLRQALKKLSPVQQTALVEIDFLAWIIQEILHLIAPEAAYWMY
jgi:hypothetical protein